MVIKKKNRSKVKRSKLKRVKRTVKRSLKRRSFKNTKRKKINRKKKRTKRMKGGTQLPSEIKKEDYSGADSVARGNFSEIFRFDEKIIKKMKYDNSDYFDKKHFTDKFLKEVVIMESLNNCSPMISPTIYAYDMSNPEEYWILMEYLENLDITDTKLFSKNAFKTLDALYERGYAHCDIKKGNFVVTSDNGFKFIDFGEATNTKSNGRFFPLMGNEFEIPKFIKDIAPWVGRISLFSIIKDLEILKFCDILCLMHEIFRIDPDIRSDFEKKLVDCESFEDFVSLYNNFRIQIGLIEYDGFEGFSFTVPNLCVDQLLFKNIIDGEAFPGSEVLLSALIEKLFTGEQQDVIKSNQQILLTTEYADYLRDQNGTVITVMEIPFEVNNLP